MADTLHADVLAQFAEMPSSAFHAVGRVAAARADHGMVVMLQSNSGFLPFLRNTVCSLQRLAVNNWLVIALDNVTCPAFEATSLTADQISTAKTTRGACAFPYGVDASSSSSGKAPFSLQRGIAEYGSLPFVRMVMQKPLWIKWLLEQGYAVLQCDLDIVWLRDPQPHLRSLLVAPQPTWSSRRAHPVAELPLGSPKLPRVHIPRTGHDPHLWPHNESLRPMVPDIVIQSEQVHGLNSGFFFIRPTDASLQLVTAWLERILAQARLGNFTAMRGVDEQHAFNSALMRIKIASDGHSNFTYGSLEDDLFPNGKIWWQYPMWADKRVAFVVHANWNKSQKKARFMRDHLWFLDGRDAQCAAGFDPFRDDCNKLCVPVHTAPPGGTKPLVRKTCQGLNNEDDRHARKHGRLWESSKGVWENLRGQFWHPTAYTALGCKRNTTVIVPYAAQIHQKLWVVAAERS